MCTQTKTGPSPDSSQASTTFMTRPRRPPCPGPRRHRSRAEAHGLTEVAVGGDPEGPVATLLELLCQRGYVWRKPRADPTCGSCGGHAVLTGLEPGHHRGEGRPGPAGRSPGSLEAKTLGRPRVQPRAGGARVAPGAQVVRPQSVHRHQHHVWLLSHSGRPTGHHRQHERHVA